MPNHKFILSGPDFDGDEFYGSVAEYIIPKMKNHPPNDIVQTDLKTDETITHRDFLKLCLQFTEGIIKFGARKGDIVSIACNHSIKATASAMGVMFSGAVLNPLDPNLKLVELQHLLKKFQPKFIICESDTAKKFKATADSVHLDTKIIIIDSGKDIEPGFYKWEDVTTDVNVETYVPRGVDDPKKDIVFIPCSSGSTGLPKGVTLSHYSVIFNNNHWIKAFMPIQSDGYFITSPLFWISGVYSLIMTSVTGRTRWIPKSTNLEDIMESVQRFKPNYIIIAPANLLRIVEHSDFSKYDLSSLKVVFTTGAILMENIAKKIMEKWSDIKLFQLYGMTEAGSALTEAPKDCNIRSIGVLLWEVKLKVVDVSTGEILGPNKVGECRIKTKGMMNGYYNDEEKTKAAFDEDGYFCTGDYVYYDERGLIYVLGRLKENIKFRNYQISPVEIESFITCLPGVKDVVVVPIPNEADDSHIRALVVKYPDATITEEYIIQSVKDNFVDFKQLRGGVQFVYSIPRSEAGKLKRLAALEMALSF